MSKESSILLLGIVVAVTQFLGLPSSWKNGIFFIAGVAIATLAFSLRRQRSLHFGVSSGEHHNDVYAQSGVPPAQE